MTSSSRLVVLLMLPLHAGCNHPPEVGAVTGCVTVHGEPASQVLVTFHPTSNTSSEITSSAVTDEQGYFDLRCQDGRSGAVIGSHRVTLEDLRPYYAPRSDDSALATRVSSRLPAYYRSVATTPLTSSVAHGSQTATFRIEP